MQPVFHNMNKFCENYEQNYITKSIHMKELYLFFLNLAYFLFVILY